MNPAPAVEAFFEKLGALVEERWSAENFDDAIFAGIALRALQDMPPAEHVDYLQIVDWVMAANRLPPQDLYSTFGQPPLTLYKNDLFFIEALFWLDAHTLIHQHAFAGAFHLLHGSSLHCCYDFALDHRINCRLLIGEVHLKSAECLMRGDSRAIPPGRQFSHMTFHLEEPTVTIVIRTLVNEESQPQYEYLKPSVACVHLANRDLMARRVELLNMLRGSDHPDHLRHVRHLVSHSDFETTFWVLEHSHRHLQRDDFTRLLEQAREHHGRLVDSVVPVFQQIRRADTIKHRCQFIDKPEHRLLLGLLLALPDRATILNFIRWHFDGHPIERIVTWIREMANISTGDSTKPNVLGIHFDELSHFIFKSLLGGLSFGVMKEQLKQEYDPEDVDGQEAELRELFDAFHNSVLFAPLFVDTGASTLEITGRRWANGGPSLGRQIAAKAEAAVRGIAFHCFLDEQLLDLIPPRARKSMSAGNEGGESIVNPTFRYQAAADPLAAGLPAELRGQGLPLQSFLPGYPLVWIEYPATEIWTPFWARREDAALLAAFEPGQPPPSTLDQEKRNVWGLAKILMQSDHHEPRDQQWERGWRKMRKEFGTKGYVVIRDLIPCLALAGMRRYYRELVAAWTLPLGDGQVGRRYSLHSEPLARFFHQQLARFVSRIAGEPVKPSFVFFAAYQPGAVLEPHLDRDQCQFSISFLVDYVPEPQDLSGWPLFVKRKGASAAPTPVDFGVGDGVVYKGCELLHSREALPAHHLSTSLFFHYVPQHFHGDLE